MSKPHFLMLAHPYDEEKHGIGGAYASEKLDGQRAIYIPGTRGLLKSQVPWANHAKDDRYVEPPVCSGLWSRYGNVIHAPDEWLDQLPEIFMDGELFLARGRGARQELSTIIRKLNPDASDWERVKFKVFDLPSPEAIFADRYVNVPNYIKDFDGMLQWWEDLGVTLNYRAKPGTTFRTTVVLMEQHIPQLMHKQHQLPFSTMMARETLKGMMDYIESVDGEGMVVRLPDSRYVTERSHNLLKVKTLADDEATVIGYVTGRETDKGSKLLGLMGALILNYGGIRFELSGFTDHERRLDWAPGVCRAEATCSPTEWAINNPGQEVPDWIEAPEFPRGASVTFKFRDKTRAGAPNEARYLRRRHPE